MTFTHSNTNHYETHNNDLPPKVVPTTELVFGASWLEALVKEVFEQVRVRGGTLVAVQPRPEYQPIFACAVGQGVRNGRGEWI